MKDDMWSKIDFDHTIKDFEFTRKAMNEIHKVVYSGDFEDMDADMIFSYINTAVVFPWQSGDIIIKVI